MSAAPKRQRATDGTASISPEEQHNQDLKAAQSQGELKAQQAAQMGYQAGQQKVQEAAQMGYQAGQQRAQEAYDAGKEHGKEQGADEAVRLIAEKQKADIEQMEAEKARIAQGAAELLRAQEAFARQKQAYEARKASSQQQESAEHAESGAAGMGMNDDDDEATSAEGKSSSATGRSSAATGGKGSRAYRGSGSQTTGASGRGGGRFKPAGPARTGDEEVIEALMQHLKLNPQQSDPLRRDPESRCVQWGCHGYPVTEELLTKMTKEKVRPVFCRGRWDDDEFVPTSFYIVHSVDTKDRFNALGQRDVRTWVNVQRVEWYDIGWQNPSSGEKMYLDNSGRIDWPLLKFKIKPESTSVLLGNMQFFCGMVAGKVGFAPITADDELKITFPSPDDGQTFVDERTKLPMTMWEGIAWTRRGDYWYTIEHTKDGDIWWAQDADRNWLCLRDGVWSTRDAKGNWHAKQ